MPRKALNDFSKANKPKKMPIFLHNVCDGACFIKQFNSTKEVEVASSSHLTRSSSKSSFLIAYGIVSKQFML